MIETKDMKNITIKSSLLTSDEIVKLIKEFEKRKRLKISLGKLRRILTIDKSAEEIIGEIYEEIVR